MCITKEKSDLFKKTRFGWTALSGVVLFCIFILVFFIVLFPHNVVAIFVMSIVTLIVTEGYAIALIYVCCCGNSHPSTSNEGKSFQTLSNQDEQDDRETETTPLYHEDEPLPQPQVIVDTDSPPQYPDDIPYPGTVEYVSLPPS